ncbi:quinoprotein relay system zinc metallohydrolase 1 [Piscinibacter sakaiensis]|uniref:quinoprotein relay system zinc metallohydrolase 1 n=1 Tax=Piscinibacter sakaiensis TaxID=1547922 RepID=UPI003728B536
MVEGSNADFSPANGCNIINTGFIATDDGVLVINTGPSRRYGEQLRALAERTAGRPVRGVLQLNLHPDYFLGNQAFAEVPRWATPATRAGVAREAAAYEDNLYRLCGDWMKGTQALAPDRDLPLPADGRWVVGGRVLHLQVLAGHTDSDLVLTDVASGVVFAGGLVFVDRVPTTPHARLREWQESLDRLQALPARVLVPSHGTVLVGRDGEAPAGAPGIAQTRAYLRWLDESFTRLAEEGASADEVLRARVPVAFRSWAAWDTEYVRNVTHLYPAYELRALRPAAPRR